MRAIRIYDFIKSKTKCTIRIAVVLAAFAFIFYKLYNYKELSQFQLFESWGDKHILNLSLCILLMPVNWLIESMKWKLAMKKIESVSLSLAIKSVFIGLTYGIFTPYRLGEFAGRPFLIKKENRFSSVLATIVGSVSQSITTISMGIIGLFIYFILNSKLKLFSTNWLILFFSISIFTCLILNYLYFKPTLILNLFRKINIFKSLRNKLEFLKQYKKKELFIILIFSQLRYIIFSFQYYLLLTFFGIQINIVDAFSAISLSYLFLFSIPGIPIVEIGIRGSMALFFIGKYSDNELAILSASTCLWIINLVLPSILGSYFIINFKNNHQNTL